jgi:hypothetical protein
MGFYVLRWSTINDVVQTQHLVQYHRQLKMQLLHDAAYIRHLIHDNFSPL